MRTAKDRIRHTILYEAILLTISIIALTLIFDKPVGTVGTLSIVVSLLAMGWNYLYNLLFDKALLAMGRPLYPRGFILRSIHAASFEIGFTIVSIPAIMTLLGVSLWQALATDLGYLVGVPIYTFLYNWVYDRVFPPVMQPAPAE